ncbi:hypothetical protein D6853_08730 [Butyrivibrio sp. X503]|uniref:DUF5721 family protein n=1 Tax=Butyrivibrio sp. X503 TaxID=2364878 RepID=UPI000EA90A7C|nr:DUF5721 family protein [Butyrivibrio sp. X503]RKM55630.1 hypothetical protein D6853_08730 [Butyrivibrio sp. X503]
MISVKISNNKAFMKSLLTTELFDNFYVEEVAIDTFNSFYIDGHLHKEFFNDEENTDTSALADFSTWSELRPICLDLIKGKRTPLKFKFVFHLNESETAKIIEKAGADLFPSDIKLAINIRFSNGELVITTGTAFSVFTLDKSIEKAWDCYFPSFLESNEITLQYL